MGGVPTLVAVVCSQDQLSAWGRSLREWREWSSPPNSLLPGSFPL